MMNKQKAEVDDRWLSVDEIGKYLGVSSDTVYRWIDKQGMPALFEIDDEFAIQDLSD